MTALVLLSFSALAVDVEGLKMASKARMQTACGTIAEGFRQLIKADLESWDEALKKDFLSTFKDESEESLVSEFYFAIEMHYFGPTIVCRTLVEEERNTALFNEDEMKTFLRGILNTQFLSFPSVIREEVDKIFPTLGKKIKGAAAIITQKFTRELQTDEDFFLKVIWMEKGQ